MFEFACCTLSRKKLLALFLKNGPGFLTSSLSFLLKMLDPSPPPLARETTPELG